MNTTANRSIKPAFRLLNLLAVVFLLRAGVAGAQNLASNPGFETGDTSGWFAFGSPTLSVETNSVHSGSYAVLVTNRTATYMGIAQSFQGILPPGQVYNVSVWVQPAGGISQTMQLTMQKVDGSGTTYTAIGSGSVPAGAWTQLGGQYVLNVSGTLTGLTLYIEVPSSATVAYYLDDLQVAAVAVPPTNGQCTVDGSNVFQRIDGFGASSAWDGSWTPVQADMFFSTNSGTGVSLDGKTTFPFNGIGLSLLRNHIVYAGSTASSAIPGTAEISIMQMAQARGALVWSTPWTPASGFKSNNGPNGGNYLGIGNNATNLAYARQLANYVSSMKTSHGINLYALSIQNEPDANVTNYEACVWTGAQYHDFVTNLYSALAAKGVGSTKIILPESESWSGNTGLFTPTLNDASAAADVSIIADHDYVANNVVGDTNTPPQLPVAGKSLWETEVAQIGGGFDGSIADAVYWAGRIHLYLTAAQANAWHYWWLIPSLSNPDNEGLTDTNGIPAKRMYALGQFARFVRPNYYRLDVGNNSGPALVSAYRDSGSSNFAVVAINPSLTTVTQAFNLVNLAGVASVTPWITSATMSLSNQPPVFVGGSSFSYVLPAMSIVTFAGQVSAGASLTLAPIPNQTLNAGMTLVITNVAMDANVPSVGLDFSLLLGPANATLAPDGSGTNAIFTWRPSVGQAGTTNPISVEVAESGSPNVSATNYFTVTVDPLAQPILGPISVSGGQFSLTVNGAQGPDYTLLFSTNLTTWQMLRTTNPAAMPFQFTLPTFTDLQQYFRLELGP
jgi:glucuronoarabinoxylan endo-1,4-beta-xylanase